MTAATGEAADILPEVADWICAVTLTVPKGCVWITLYGIVTSTYLAVMWAAVMATVTAWLCDPQLTLRVSPTAGGITPVPAWGSCTRTTVPLFHTSETYSALSAVPVATWVALLVA